jgi:hypothetical protein
LLAKWQKEHSSFKPIEPLTGFAKNREVRGEARLRNGVPTFSATRIASRT